METSIYDVLIIGAGCAGLSAANQLKDHKYLVLEKEDRIGGRVNSINIHGSIAETGALFPIRPGQPASNRPPYISSATDSNNLLICYHAKDGRSFYGASVRNVLDQISPRNNSNLASFFQVRKTLNPRLKYEILNGEYGQLTGLDKYQTEALDSFFQITISGAIKDCIRQLRPQIVSNIARPDLSTSNSFRLASLYNHILPSIQLNTTVLSIESVQSHCEVLVDYFGQEIILRSKYVLVSAPPPQSLPLIRDARTESVHFYNSIPYMSGTVGILYIEGVIPPYELLVASTASWSSAFVSRLSSTSYIIHVYFPACKGYQVCSSSLTVDSIYSDLLTYIPKPCQLICGHLRHWKHVSPLLHTESLTRYTPDHFKVTDRIWLCGELAGLCPERPFAYGTQAAMNTGSRISQQLICELNNSDHPRYEGLFYSDLFRLDDHRPTYLRSRIDGNIAFYGILLSAYKSDQLQDYLKNHMIDGQWEFHTGFGVTLEDSLLVLEGILDTDHEFKMQAISNMANYYNRYYNRNEDLFVTHNNITTDYWSGPSVFGNAQILYILNKLNQSPSEHFHAKVIDFFTRSQLPNLLWRSKWFANDVFTTFYVVRSIMSCSTKHIAPFQLTALAEYLVGVLSNSINSEEDLITITYALRTLFLMSTFKSESFTLWPLKSRILSLASHYTSTLTNLDRLNPGVFLYYWQDLKQSGDSTKVRTMTTSRPRSDILQAMLTLMKNDYQSFLEAV